MKAADPKGKARALPVDRTTIAAAAIVYLTIGGNFLGFQVAVESVPPFLATTIRALTGGVLLLGIAALRRGITGGHAGERLDAPQLKATAIQAFLLLVLGQSSVAWSLQTLPAGTAAIITSSMPIWVALLSMLWLRRPLGRRSLLGVLIGFAGLGTLAFARENGGVALSGKTLIPAFVALAGSIATAAGVLYGQRANGPRDGLLGTALQMIFAGVVVGLVAVVAGEPGRFAPAMVSGRSLLAIGYLIVFGTIAGYSALVWLTGHAPPGLAASFAYVGPIVALALSAALLGEHIGIAKIIAAILALAGAALMASDSDSAGTGKQRRARSPSAKRAK